MPWAGMTARPWRWVRAAHELGPGLVHPNDVDLSSGTPASEIWGTRRLSLTGGGIVFWGGEAESSAFWCPLRRLPRHSFHQRAADNLDEGALTASPISAEAAWCVSGNICHDKESAVFDDVGDSYVYTRIDVLGVDVEPLDYVLDHTFGDARMRFAKPLKGEFMRQCLLGGLFGQRDHFF